MGAIRLALVACKEATIGPWIVAKGNELRVKVSRLAEGECVRIEMEGGHATELQEPGTFLLTPMTKKNRYRVVKETNGCEHPMPTTVEVIYG